MASIRQTKNGSFEVQIRKVGWPQVTRMFDMRETAKAWASEQEARMVCGTYRDQSALRTVEFAQLLRRYRDEVSVHKKGHAVETLRLEGFLRHPIARLKLSALTSGVFAAWRDARLKQVSGSTVNRELNLLSHVISVAIKDWDYPITHPMVAFRRPKNARARTRMPTWRELRRLAKELNLRGRATSDGTRNPWVATIVALAIRTAMRRGEILGLRWRDVDLTRGAIQVRDSKNGTARTVPIASRSMTRRLQALPRGAADDAVFPISADALKKAYVRACTRAHIDDLHFHDLRHLGTTQLAKKLNQMELMAVTGHKQVSMVMRYFHPSNETLISKLRAM